MKKHSVTQLRWRFSPDLLTDIVYAPGGGFSPTRATIVEAKAVLDGEAGTLLVHFNVDREHGSYTSELREKLLSRLGGLVYEGLVENSSSSKTVVRRTDVKFRFQRMEGEEFTDTIMAIFQRLLEACGVETPWMEIPAPRVVQKTYIRYGGEHYTFGEYLRVRFNGGDRKEQVMWRRRQKTS